MPKPSTYPTLYNEALQISMTKLKEWGYLRPNQVRTGTITWSKNGHTTGNITITVSTLPGDEYLELDYKFRNDPRMYRVYLVSTPSNLGKGQIWYFECPQTGKKCRKLYSIGGYFLHREAFNGCMYECQTQSKKWRHFD